VHKRNIVHLDLKPENIMLINDNLSIETLIKPGFIKLIDFGLAINVEQKESKRNVFIGSLRYASRNSHKGDLLGYRDDLESLIYVLIYLKTGKKMSKKRPSSLADTK
jgi:casein kinase 1